MQRNPGEIPKTVELHDGLMITILGPTPARLEEFIDKWAEEVELATNAEERLRPGMYVNVAVVLAGREKVLAIPSTAVLYAPYSDSVFIVEDPPEPNPGQPVKVVRQQFAQLGEKHGDFVAVRSGLKEGDTIVSTGVFKLRNGQTVTVENTLSPEFKLSLKPSEN